MSDLDLSQIEEVPHTPVPAQFEPPIEEVIKTAGINVRKVNDEITLLAFITPFKQMTFVLDHEACKFVAEQLNPSKIIPATLADLPK